MPHSPGTPNLDTKTKEKMFSGIKINKLTASGLGCTFDTGANTRKIGPGGGGTSKLPGVTKGILSRKSKIAKP